MRIFIISDTHGYHNQLTIPDCDLIIHCGDESNKSNPYENELECRRFFEWFRVLPTKKIFVAGNHSTAIFNNLVRPEEYPEVEFLIHQETTFQGYKIFGSPWTPSYGNSWAYMRKRNQMSVVWENVPDCDILITHGPPKGILDLTDDKDTGNTVQVGCKSLLNKVLEIKPRIHCFGHIHNHSTDLFNNFGIFQSSNLETMFVNAACLDHTGKFYNGHVINLTK